MLAQCSIAEQDPTPSLTDRVCYVEHNTKGSYLPRKVLTMTVPSGNISLVRVHAIGYDTKTGDTFSTTVTAPVKNFGEIVTIVGDQRASDIVVDSPVRHWRVVMVPDTICGGVSILVQSDSTRWVTWKLFAECI